MDGKGYGQIRLIEVEDIPPAHSGPWLELLTELKLRLEKTGPGQALVVTFEDRKNAVAAYKAICKTFAEQPGRVDKRMSPTMSYVYVHRTAGDNGHVGAAAQDDVPEEG